ncbi:hypothetical protein C0993_010038 [Termitomyces sp. T159_Od127]|nr:hypothetical protein C0993_010038 [Termitomyces sp. T159_Od127]
MSSRASSTIGNMPPRHGKKLADVMDEAFRSNSRAVDEADTEKAEGDEQSEAPVAPLNAETVSAPAKSQNAGRAKGYTNSKSPSVENDSAPAEPARTKRKQATKAKQTHATEGSDNEAASNPPAKKRRISEDARTNALKDVAELEASIKKLQSSVTKDLKHLAQLAATLAAQLNETD